MSGLFALATPRRIKASHRRRGKVASGQSVQRYYDPMIGRFLSVDPVTANSGTGANFNRYWYANNNPYKFTDPDGRMIQDRSDPFGSWGRKRPFNNPCGQPVCLDQNGRDNKDGKNTHSKNESPITTIETTTVRPDPIDRWGDTNTLGQGCSFTASMSTCGAQADYVKATVGSYVFNGSGAITKNGTVFAGGGVVHGTPKAVVDYKKPSWSVSLGFMTRPTTGTEVDNYMRGATTGSGWYTPRGGGSYNYNTTGSSVEIGLGQGGPYIQPVEYMQQVYPGPSE